MNKTLNKILRLLPDKQFIQVFYFYHLRKIPNLRNPKSFNEKMQWLKLNDRKPEYTMMVDKLKVKEFIASLLGEEYVIPTIAEWDNPNEIDFSLLPNTFVLKANHDSGSVVICRDKSKLDIEKALAKLNRKMSDSFYWYAREWPYKNVKPRVFAEKYMEDDSTVNANIDINGLIDYKFFCFNGEPKFVYVSKGLENHSTAGISFYDLDGKEMPFYRSDFARLGDIVFPDNFKDMTSCAKIIAEKTQSPFARVDLYSIGSKIYFSEITFHPASGVIPFVPEEWDRKLGDMIDLRSVKDGIVNG